MRHMKLRGYFTILAQTSPILHCLSIMSMFLSLLAGGDSVVWLARRAGRPTSRRRVVRLVIYRSMEATYIFPPQSRDWHFREVSLRLARAVT